MKPLLIRADATARMGTGHVMRGLALAQAWQDAGGTVTFAATSLPHTLRERLIDEGCAVESVTAEMGSLADAHATCTFVNAIGADWVVLDGYQFGDVFQQTLKDSGRRVLAIDDYGHADRYSADIVLNQNLGAEERLYANRGANTRLLLGPRFALLRREFTTATAWERTTPEIARKVLVTLGGADPDNVTLAVIEAIGRVRIDGLEAIVVVGGANPHRATLENAAARSDARIELRTDVRDMATLMRWADVAVAAGGSTTWERAASGLPGLVLILADNQTAVAAALDATGLGVNLGWYHQTSVHSLALKIEQILVAQDARSLMATRGRALVDGQGGARVTDALTNRAAIFLRRATASDSLLLWQWVHDPTVRNSAFTSDPIPWADHIAWFTRRLSDLNSRIYIAEVMTGEPVGQIRFNLSETGEAEIDVSVAVDRRGGTGAAVIRAGVEQIFAEGWATRVHAHIKPENAASLGAFRKAGFTVVGLKEINGHQATHAVREVLRD